MHKKIYADVSELMSWVGPVTGIQRVNVSIVLEGLKTNDKLRLVNYSPLFKTIEKVDTVDFLFRFDDARTVELKSFPLILKFKIKQIVEKFKNSVPLSMRGPLIRLKRKFNFFMQNLLLRIHRFFGIERVKAPFAKGDVYLILGNSWGRAQITDIMQDLRNQFDVKIAHIIFDMIPWLRPEYFERDFAKHYSCELEKVMKASDLLFAISKSTAKDVGLFCSLLKIKTPEISVIRLGDDVAHFNKSVPVDRLVDKTFILCVGTIEIRKNHRILLDVWSHLRKELGDKTPVLVLVGRHGWLIDELIYKMQNSPDLKRDVLWLRDILDQQIAWLYRNCLFTIYPSHYEGWGLPVAESLALGQICLASNSSSIPEIGGDLVQYFSPTDQEGLKDLLVSMINCTPRELQTQREKIKKNYKIHAWADTAKIVFNAVESL